MTRDYKKEAAWQREKYLSVSALIDKQTGKAFKTALKARGDKYADWLRIRIAEYLAGSN